MYNATFLKHGNSKRSLEYVRYADLGEAGFPQTAGGLVQLALGLAFVSDERLYQTDLS